MIPIAGIVVGFPLLAGLFGWAVLGRLSHLDRAERFAAAWGVSFAFLAASQFLSFALHANQTWFSLASLIVMGFIAVLCRPWRTRKPADDDPGFSFLVVACGLAYLHLLCIQALLPNYRGSSWYYDWCMHYEEALVFVGDRPVDDTWANGYTLASRTPLFNLTTAFVMSLAGHDFTSFQMASVLTNIAFVAAVYLLLRDLFGPRAARMAVLLAPLNLWMLHNAWYTWPKMLAAYYVLLALHFYIQSVRSRADDPRKASVQFCCFGIAGLLGFMTHQVSLVYVLPLLTHAAVLAWMDKAARPRLLELAALAGAIVFLVMPWYGWLAATLGADKIAHSTPATLGEERARYRPLEVFSWMRFNLMYSVVPAYVIRAFFTDWPEDIGTPNNFGELIQGLGQVRLKPPDPLELYDGATYLYFSLLTGAVTLSLVTFLAYRLYKRRRGYKSMVTSQPASDRRVRWAVWLFIGLGAAGAAFLHPGKMWWGIAHSAAFPSAIVLVALGWGVLSHANRRAGMIVSAGIVLEFLAMFWSHWWFLTHRPDVLEPLPGNESYKKIGLVFLNDAIGAGQYGFLASVLAVQAILCLLLVRFWRAACPDS
jgi:hypothetical protein